MPATWTLAIIFHRPRCGGGTGPAGWPRAFASSVPAFFHSLRQVYGLSGGLGNSRPPQRGAVEKPRSYGVPARSPKSCRVWIYSVGSHSQLSS